MAGPVSASTATSVWYKIRLWFTFGIIGNSIRTKACFEDQQVELLKGKHGEKGTSQDASSSSSSQLPDYVNYGEEDEMEIQGYKENKLWKGIIYFFIVITGGILRLIFHWAPTLMLKSTCRRCPLKEADQVLLTEHYQQKYKRHYVKVVKTLSSDCLRTRQLGEAAGINSNDKNVDDTIWEQKVEEELKTMDNPKLVILKSDGTTQETEELRTFTCKRLRYIWDEQQEGFIKLPGFDNVSPFYLHARTGLSVFEQWRRRVIYGNNEIKVEVQNIVKLLFLEVLNPFYVFQIFSIILWLTDDYIYFAIAIFVMSVLGISSAVMQTRKNQANLRATVQSSGMVEVCRQNGLVEKIPTEQLVPGDLIVIPEHGYTMHCDAALLCGNCIVNESMLTGESVPVTKIPLPNRDDVAYNIKEHARHTLFCGTSIIQTRYYGSERVLAIVVRTGYLTAKGSLVRSIMYPPPADYRFERDSYRFVGVLAFIALCGFSYSIYLKVMHNVSLREIIVDSLDLITIVVPPALPAAMTVGRLYAQKRLQWKGIFCISPRSINVAGSLDCVCFDKTGTLTEDGLDMWGAVPTNLATGMKSSYENIYPSLNETDKSGFVAPIRNVAHLSPGPLLVGMTTCHSLTRIDGKLIGDPLDLKMFEWTDWLLEEPGVADNQKFDIATPTIVRPNTTEVNDNVPSTKHQIGGEVMSEVGIVRQFPFSSSLQRMSVITRKLGATEFELYCKGSPEMVASLSLPETIPANFTTTLEKYTQHGYRVIALGYRKLPLNYVKAQRVVREEVECKLTFLGLIILENRLKPATTSAIKGHKKADLRTIMVTGDNMLTAISVARECTMIEPHEKIIVVTTEADRPGYEVQDFQKQTLIYSYEAKPGGTDSGNQSPGSVGTGSLMEQTLINIEAPANHYRFALTGNAFSVAKTLYPEVLLKLLVRGSVFARMNPEQKQHLVEHLQNLGYFVAMCGDGANDCGALKAAHAGISLSDAESSVASPFTSKEANITCVLDLIREGRAALVTSFGIFKYMAIYSLTQFISVILLYTIDSNLSDLQFLYIDLFLISVFAFTFGHTDPHPGDLVKQPPSASLVSPAPVVSLVAHMLTTVGFQTFAFMYVQHQTWYEPLVPRENGENFDCYENFTVFAVSGFQYIIMAVVFSQGRPYRKGFWTNKWLMMSLVALTSLTAYIILYPAPFIISLLRMKVPPTINFRLTLIVFSIFNFIIAVMIEQGLVNFCLAKRLNTKSARARQGYIAIENELSRMEDWPPVSPPEAASNIMEFSKRKVILPQTMKSHTLERPSLSSNKERPSRRHSNSVSIPIPMADYLGHQPLTNSIAEASNSESGYGVSADCSSNDSVAVSTHINNCLNNANTNLGYNDSRIPLDSHPRS